MTELYFLQIKEIKGKFYKVIAINPFLFCVKDESVDILNMQYNTLSSIDVKYKSVYRHDNIIYFVDGCDACMLIVNGTRINVLKKTFKKNVIKVLFVGHLEIILYDCGKLEINGNHVEDHVTGFYVSFKYLYLVQNSSLLRIKLDNQLKFESFVESEKIDLPEYNAINIFKNDIILIIKENEFIFHEFKSSESKVNNYIHEKDALYYYDFIEDCIIVTNNKTDEFIYFNTKKMAEEYIDDEIANLRNKKTEDNIILYSQGINIEGNYIYMLNKESVLIFVNRKEENLEVVEKINLVEIDEYKKINPFYSTTTNEKTASENMNSTGNLSDVASSFKVYEENDMKSSISDKNDKYIENEEETFKDTCIKELAINIGENKTTVNEAKVNNGEKLLIEPQKLIMSPDTVIINEKTGTASFSSKNISDSVNCGISNEKDKLNKFHFNNPFNKSSTIETKKYTESEAKTINSKDEQIYTGNKNKDVFPTNIFTSFQNTATPYSSNDSKNNNLFVKDTDYDKIEINKKILHGLHDLSNSVSNKTVNEQKNINTSIFDNKNVDGLQDLSNSVNDVNRLDIDNKNINCLQNSSSFLSNKTANNQNKMNTFDSKIDMNTSHDYTTNSASNKNETRENDIDLNKKFTVFKATSDNMDGKKETDLFQKKQIKPQESVSSLFSMNSIINESDISELKSDFFTKKSAHNFTDAFNICKNNDDKKTTNKFNTINLDLSEISKKEEKNIFQSEYDQIKKSLIDEFDQLLYEFKGLEVPQYSFNNFNYTESSLDMLFRNVYKKILYVNSDKCKHNIEYKIDLLEHYLNNMNLKNQTETLNYIDNFIINYGNSNFHIPYRHIDDINEGIKSISIESKSSVITDLLNSLNLDPGTSEKSNNVDKGTSFTTNNNIFSTDKVNLENNNNLSQITENLPKPTNITSTFKPDTINNNSLVNTYNTNNLFSSNAGINGQHFESFNSNNPFLNQQQNIITPNVMNNNNPFLSTNIPNLSNIVNNDQQKNNQKQDTVQPESQSAFSKLANQRKKYF